VLAEVNGLPLFKFESFPTAGIAHGISTRLGGVSEAPYDTLNISRLVPDEPTRVQENCRRFASALGFVPGRMLMAKQTHRDDVLVVDSDDEFASALDSPDRFPKVDIQITDCPGWLLSLRYADCVPLLMVHPERRVVAVVHAGWRGTLKGAARTAVRALDERYGAEPSGLLVGIGPSIGGCCYEVGDEVAGPFEAASQAGQPWDGALKIDPVRRSSGMKPYLNLQEANRATCQAAGVPSEQIETAEVCTRCHSDVYFSHRAMGVPAGRFSAAIGLT
jgi:YfiH family protein